MERVEAECGNADAGAALGRGDDTASLSSSNARCSRPRHRQPLLTQAAGNPLYAEEYVRLLAAREGGVEPGTAPDTVQGIIAARVDGLPVEEKVLLQDAAVVGRVFWSGAVGVLAGRDRWAVEERLLALERGAPAAGASIGRRGGDQYGFNHELMRDVAYGGIPHADRSNKHRRAAEWIESLGRPDDTWSYSWTTTSAPSSTRPGTTRANRNLATRARLALRDAGDRASALSAFAEATGLYREALRLWPSDDPERPQLLFGYALALHVTGDQQREQLLEEARAALLETGDLATAAEADALLAEMWWYLGRGDRVEQHLERAMSLVVQLRRQSPRARDRRQVPFDRGACGGGIRVARDALALAEELDLSSSRQMHSSLWAADGGNLATTAGMRISSAASRSRSSQRAARGRARIQQPRGLDGRQGRKHQAAPSVAASCRAPR